MLEEIGPQVDRKQTRVLMDGGVRSGADVLIARALGADAVLIGRAYAYGLGAGGEVGVSRALELIRADIDHHMRLLGYSSIDEVGRECLHALH
jgi:isopentenyl diphosphate isomerase/L-lactate dehydrogenase-like FMN-dependent dehydrogenase